MLHLKHFLVNFYIRDLRIDLYFESYNNYMRPGIKFGGMAKW